jgi:hypothetical protein
MPILRQYCEVSSYHTSRPKLTISFSVVEPEPEPELEPQGAGTFGRSRSWSQYTEVSAPAPGQTKVVNLIIILIE